MAVTTAASATRSTISSHSSAATTLRAATTSPSEPRRAVEQRDRDEPAGLTAVRLVTAEAVRAARCGEEASRQEAAGSFRAALRSGGAARPGRPCEGQRGPFLTFPGTMPTGEDHDSDRRQVTTGDARPRRRRTGSVRAATRLGWPTGRAGRRIPELRIQPATVAGTVPARPGHPGWRCCTGVACRIDGPRLRRHRRTGQRRRRPVTDRRPGPLPHHHQALPLGIVGNQTPAAPPRAVRCSRSGPGARCCLNAPPTPSPRAVPLFRWPVVITVIASVRRDDYWLFASHGLGAGLQQILRNPMPASRAAPARSMNAVTQQAAVTAARGPA